jgi:uncharacterized protein with PIN domain
MRCAVGSPRWQSALFVISAIDAASIFFIRCERCKEPLVSLRPDKITNLWRIMAPQSHCPKCGVARR